MENIRIALEADVAKVAAMYDDLHDYISTHINHCGWTKNIYPTEETAKKGFAESSLYIVEIDDAIAATIILNGIQSEEYKDDPWLFPAEDDEVIVVHTLAVHPDFMGMGIAKKLLIFTETLGRQTHKKVIRFDTNENNIPASKLYESSGFTYSGLVDLRGNSHGPKGSLYKRFEKLI